MRFMYFSFLLIPMVYACNKDTVAPYEGKWEMTSMVTSYDSWDITFAEYEFVSENMLNIIHTGDVGGGITTNYAYEVEADTLRMIMNGEMREYIVRFPSNESMNWEQMNNADSVKYYFHKVE